MLKLSLFLFIGVISGFSVAFAGEPTLSQKVGNPTIVKEILSSVNSELAQYHQQISAPEELKSTGVIERRAQNELEFGFETNFTGCNVYVGVRVTTDTNEFVSYGTQSICILD